MIRIFFILVASAVNVVISGESVGNRFTYLEENDPYYPNADFPKLITPMWVGEDGVDAVVCLTIDDMCRLFPEGERPRGLPTYARRPKHYYNFLKPVLERLRKIDGRAPVTAFCLQLDPDDKLVHHMQKIGMSMECHTWTHPVPLMRTIGDPPPSAPTSLQPAINDTLKSLSNLSKLPGPGPVAHRNPGCDARNTASPRMFAEIFPLRTPEGHFLRMDSSIFMVFADPGDGIPGEWLFHKDGRKRFEKFVHGIPYTKTYRNYVVDYPYPFVINRTIWELPAAVPGDAHGVHAYDTKSDETVTDWKRALDITVAMKGIYTLCFHPHGYIEGEQVAELVDYANRTYGNRVKFLNCREVYDRLTANLCQGVALRENDGSDAGVRLADVNGDKFLDVLIGGLGVTRVWDPETKQFRSVPLPVRDFPQEAQLFAIDRDGRAGLARHSGEGIRGWHFQKGRWEKVEIDLPEDFALSLEPDRYRYRDLNGDGISDLIVNGSRVNEIHLLRKFGDGLRLEKAGFALPHLEMIFNGEGKDGGLRFVDLDRDGDEDLVYANEREFGVWRFQDQNVGWVNVRKGFASDPDALSPIAERGRNNGAWFHSDELIQVNEFTAKKVDLVERKSFEELLRKPAN